MDLSVAEKIVDNNNNVREFLLVLQCFHWVVSVLSLLLMLLLLSAVLSAVLSMVVLLLLNVFDAQPFVNVKSMLTAMVKLKMNLTMMRVDDFV